MSVHDLRRAIEPLKDRALTRARTELRARLGPSPELVARLDAAEHAVLAVEATFGALADELPGLYRFRRLAGGGWVVGLQGTEIVRATGFLADYRWRQAYSRIEVCASLSEDGHSLQLVCHRTVLDTDLEILRETHALPGPSTDALATWIEAACLEFAEALLAQRAWRNTSAPR